MSVSTVIELRHVYTRNHKNPFFFFFFFKIIIPFLIKNVIAALTQKINESHNEQKGKFHLSVIQLVLLHVYYFETVPVLTHSARQKTR